MKIWKNVVAAAALAGAATFAVAEPAAEAKAMLTAANAEIASKGVAAAAAEFNNGGKWRDGKAYVVLVDFQGNMLAHSQNAKLVGKNMLDVKDAAGKPFIQETIKNVRAGGDSAIDIRWANPTTKKIDNGHLLARRVAGQEAYVGVGYWE